MASRDLTQPKKQRIERHLEHLRELPFVRDLFLLERTDAALSLQISTPTSRQELTVEPRLSNLSRVAVDALLARRQPSSDWIIFALHVGRQLGRELTERRVNFVDLAGNCHLRLGDQYWAMIEGRPASKMPVERRGVGLSGNKVLFAVLADPTLLESPVRTLADHAGVNKSVVYDFVAKLQKEGLIGAGTQRVRLLQPQVLVERWLAAYAASVRPRLFVGAFRTPDRTLQDLEARVEKAMAGGEVVWGWSGGAAAIRLTGHYKGDRSVLCTDAATPALFRQLRALAHDEGPLIMMRAPGPIAFSGTEPHTVHPLLVYSELLTTGDPRAREAADEIRERFLGYLE